MEALFEDSPDDDLDPLEPIGSPIGQSLVFVLPLGETTSRYPSGTLVARFNNLVRPVIEDIYKFFAGVDP